MNFDLGKKKRVSHPPDKLKKTGNLMTGKGCMEN